MTSSSTSSDQPERPPTTIASEPTHPRPPPARQSVPRVAPASAGQQPVTVSPGGSRPADQTVGNPCAPSGPSHVPRASATPRAGSGPTPRRCRSVDASPPPSPPRSHPLIDEVLHSPPEPAPVGPLSPSLRSWSRRLGGRYGSPGEAQFAMLRGTCQHHNRTPDAVVAKDMATTGELPSVGA